MMRYLIPVFAGLIALFWGEPLTRQYLNLF